MTSEYTIAAIPTLYRGRMYRSRLEARWAAFFDRLGWAYEYEPFDMGKWSPDFLLTDADTLVEVKPISQTTSIKPIADKISGFGKRLLIVGTSPWVFGGEFSIGWRKCDADPHERAEPNEQFNQTVLRWMPGIIKPEWRADLVCSDGANIWTMLEGNMTLKRFNTGNSYTSWGEQLWSDACNAVQWVPKR